MLNVLATTNEADRPMTKNRLESFTDGVIAIIITVMVLELHAPTVAGWQGWLPGLEPMLIYGVGFQLVAAMWVLHHNTVSHVRHLNRRMLWVNLLFLFLLSLFPLTVEAVSLHPTNPADVTMFCLNGLLCGFSLTLFRLAAVREHAGDAEFEAWNRSRGHFALVGLGGVLLAVGTAYYSTYLALGLMATIFLLVLWTG